MADLHSATKFRIMTATVTRLSHRPAVNRSRGRVLRPCKACTVSKTRHVYSGIALSRKPVTGSAIAPQTPTRVHPRSGFVVHTVRRLRARSGREHRGIESDVGGIAPFPITSARLERAPSIKRLPICATNTLTRGSIPPAERIHEVGRNRKDRNAIKRCARGRRANLATLSQLGASEFHIIRGWQCVWCAKWNDASATYCRKCGAERDHGNRI